MALKDGYSPIEARRGRDPGHIGVREEWADKGFIGAEDGIRLQTPGTAGKEFEEAEAGVDSVLDGFKVGGPCQFGIERQPKVFDGGEERDRAAVHSEVEVMRTEGAGGAAYYDRLGFGGVDGKEPPVTPLSEPVKVRLEGPVGAAKGGIEAKEGSVVGILKEVDGSGGFGHVGRVEEIEEGRQDGTLGYSCGGVEGAGDRRADGDVGRAMGEEGGKQTDIINGKGIVMEFEDEPGVPYSVVGFFQV